MIVPASAAAAEGGTVLHTGDRITDKSAPLDGNAVREWIGAEAFGHWAGLRNWIEEFYLILVAMTIIVAMIYGPVASFLVEFFPPKIRYTALSFPYHIGAGIFGGFLPFFATWLSLSVGDIFAGLWYPIVITAVVCVIGTILLPNRPDLTHDH